MLRIDTHTHILPKEWPNLKERYGYGGFVQLEHNHTNCADMIIDGKFFRKVDPNTWDPAVRIDECNDLGVDVQVLSTVPVMFNYWTKKEHSLDLSKILNDHIASVIAEHPQRFIGLGTLPMRYPDYAVQELERCVKELGLRGVEIGTHIDGWNLNEESLNPFFEAAEDLGAAIFVHPWDMMGQDDMRKYWLPWLVGMPAETSRAVCSMIFGGVFERYPKLKVLFAHGGGSFPSTIGRIEHGYNVRPDLVAVDNAVNPREYLGKFWLDSLVHDPVMLKYIVDLVGEDYIALGSDYPFPLGEHKPGALIDSMDFTDDLKSKLLGFNACNWLGVDPQAFHTHANHLHRQEQHLRG
ncbi:MAG: 2-amino-3-carboxymuconate-6-semialdehyde decarboxylase [Ectothiorhodospiraceae bacterium]|nr:2-amino-3-carboxymuconate-6-semialdehyde decarboxylase [Ectothiorhodospiraceae bacterium]